MRTKQLFSSEDEHSGYGAGSGTTERYEFECPCGKGRIVEEHDNIPGFREHDVYIQCDSCKREYNLDTSKGVRGWEIIPKS
jgi:hypothetical protein